METMEFGADETDSLGAKRLLFEKEGNMRALLIDQKTITDTKVAVLPTRELEVGEIRCRLHRFALTTNNVTYAATGFSVGYWKFFPSGVNGKGLLPVWGFANVTESLCEDIPAGVRLYGFFPLAEEWVMMKPRLRSFGRIVDLAPHRQELALVYNFYNVTPPDSSGMDEALRALLHPLLATSYLLCDWLEDNKFFGASQVIVGSASSKTGLGLCKFLAALEGNPVQVVGLTSESNHAFVEGVGACDTVVSYTDIDEIAQVPSVYVDLAGNMDVRRRLHSHLANVLCHSSAVGMSHWNQQQHQLDPPTTVALEGPKPKFFFAPAQIEKRRRDWGPGEIEKRISVATQTLISEVSEWMDVKIHVGMDAAAKVYTQIATGRARPCDGNVIEIGWAQDREGTTSTSSRL